MAYFAPPNKNEISATPSPTNAAHNAGLGKLHDSYIGLHGATGKPAEAYAAMKFFDSKTLLNLKPTFSVNTNALTITVQDKDGNALGVNNPGFVAQRHATLGDGGFNLRKLEANISLVVSAGSTLGHVANVLTPVFIYLIDNAGAQEVAVTNTYQGEVAIVSTTAEGGVGAADSATAIYSTTARANVPARLISVAWFKQAVAGNWVNLPTRLHVAPFMLSVPNDKELLRSVVRGLETAPNAVDAANDVDINPGSVLDSKGLEVMVLSSVLTKQIDTAWAVGNNQGGMLTGAVANDTWYGLWLIGRSDTGVVDAGWDPSFTTPTLPANYDRSRLIAVTRRKTAANWDWTQDGDWFKWVTAVTVLSSGTATVNTGVTLTPAVPPIAKSFEAAASINFTGPDNVSQSNSCVIGIKGGVDYGTICSGGMKEWGSTSEMMVKGGSVVVPNTGTCNYRNAQSSTSTRSSSIDVLGFSIDRQEAP